MLNDTWRSLADPNRREILKLLNGGDKSAGEIASAFDISAPSVSHHLNVLKNAGLVRSERHGQSIVYSLNTTVVQEFMQELFDLFQTGGDQNA